MSRDIKSLKNAKFLEKVLHLLQVCKDKHGIVMRPFYTVRRPEEQAKLWRQSRSTAQIDAKISQLHACEAHYLADVLDAAGPQHGRWATNALPGQSWHQWGQAIDCYWDRDGKAEWSLQSRDGKKGYEIYATEARDAGLEAGYFWGARDAVHVQLQAVSSPLATMTWVEIDMEMRHVYDD